MANATTPSSAKNVKPRFDFSGVDPSTVNVDTLDLGTNQSDCAIIAQTFERGAHSTPSEAAVFATISRTLQNNKAFAISSSASFKTYLGAPQEDAATVAQQSNQYAAAGASISGGGGSSAQTQQFMQSLNIGTQQQTTHGDSFGEKLLDKARECIPCGVRLSAFLELQPNVDLLGSFETYLKTALGNLQSVADLLNNFDTYGDLCALLNLFSFMCIPDLQRIIALFMALFILEVPELDGLIGLLTSLVMPIFAPILVGISTLLDQFVVLITNPLACVVDAINLQIKKLGFESTREGRRLKKDLKDASTKSKEVTKEINNGIKEMKKQLQEGIQKVKARMSFYTQQINAMLGEMGGGDAAYLQAKLKVLQLVRLIAFVTAIINALTRGHAACSNTGKNAEAPEIENFYQNFLNPQAPFNIYLDNNGNLKIDEDFGDLGDELEDLNETGNVFQFEGESLLDTTVLQAVEEVTVSLTSPTQVAVPCKLETTVSDVGKVNQWMEQLNQS